MVQPILGKFVLIEIFLCTLALIVSVIILKIHHRHLKTEGLPPKWLVRVLLLQPGKAQSFKEPEIKFPQEHRTSSLGDLELANNVKNLAYDSMAAGNIIILKTLEKLNFSVTKLTQCLESRESEQKKNGQWNCVFDRIDAILLFTFMGSNFFFTFITLAGVARY